MMAFPCVAHKHLRDAHRHEEGGDQGDTALLNDETVAKVVHLVASALHPSPGEEMVDPSDEGDLFDGGVRLSLVSALKLEVFELQLVPIEGLE